MHLLHDDWMTAAFVSSLAWRIHRYHKYHIVLLLHGPQFVRGSQTTLVVFIPGVQGGSGVFWAVLAYSIGIVLPTGGRQHRFGVRKQGTRRLHSLLLSSANFQFCPTHSVCLYYNKN